jgi:transketolase
MVARDTQEQSHEQLRDKARMIRREVLRMTHICGSGHYGSAFSIVELLTVLYYQLLNLRPDDSQWADRDRFTMGKGHAAIALYPVLADLGYIPASVLDNYSRLGSPLGDHPSMHRVNGVDFSSGSIGHNLSVSVGMAAGLKRKGSPGRVVCLMGDGEQTEGQIWEATISAAAWGLDNLIGIVDINGAGSDGYAQETMPTEPLAVKWRAFGWEVIDLANGHDFKQTFNALNQALNEARDRPCCVLAHTTAGKGVSFMEGHWQWHLGFLGERDLERAYAEIEAGAIG